MSEIKVDHGSTITCHAVVHDLDVFERKLKTGRRWCGQRKHQKAERRLRRLLAGRWEQANFTFGGISFVNG